MMSWLPVRTEYSATVGLKAAQSIHTPPSRGHLLPPQTTPLHTPVGRPHQSRSPLRAAWDTKLPLKNPPCAFSFHPRAGAFLPRKLVWHTGDPTIVSIHSCVSIRVTMPFPAKPNTALALLLTTLFTIGSVQGNSLVLPLHRPPRSNSGGGGEGEGRRLAARCVEASGEGGVPLALLGSTAVCRGQLWCAVGTAAQQPLLLQSGQRPGIPLVP